MRILRIRLWYQKDAKAAQEGGGCCNVLHELSPWNFQARARPLSQSPAQVVLVRAGDGLSCALSGLVATVITLARVLDRISDASRTKRRARRSTQVGGLGNAILARRGGGEVAGFGVCSVHQNQISARLCGHRFGGSAPALSEVTAPRR